MPREPIELAAMNLCCDLAPNPRVFEAVPLETYWDLVLTPGAREIYRRAARNAHIALTSQLAVKRVLEFLEAWDAQYAGEVEPVAREFFDRRKPFDLRDLTVADLRALTGHPEQSAEEARLAAERALAAGGF